MRNAFVDRLHDEAIALLLASRDWATKGASALSTGSDPIENLKIATATLRLTALVTDAVAWTLAQKAFAAGELSEKEAMADRWTPLPLAAENFTAALPETLADLIEKAEMFHRRVTNLHAQRRNRMNRRRSR